MAAHRSCQLAHVRRNGCRAHGRCGILEKAEDVRLVARDAGIANRSAEKDLLGHLADYIAHHKGTPVLISVGLAIAGLVLNVIPGLGESVGFWGWLVQHVGVVVGLLGILLGDAL